MTAEDNSSLPPEPQESPEQPPYHTEPLHRGDSEPGGVAPGPTRIQPESKWLPPENYNVPWGWFDVFVLLPLVGLILLIAFSLVIVGVDAALLHAPISHIRSHFTFIAILAQILMELSLLGYFALQIRNRSGQPFWRTIGWRSLRPKAVPRAGAYFGFILGGIALAGFVSLASLAFPPKQPLPIERIFQSRPLTMLFMATAVLVAPLVEETIFRGYLYPVTARSFGVVGGIVFTGAVFGLLHGSQLWGGWWQIGLLVVVGILFTYARAATRTNVSSFLLHISYNGVQVIGVLITLYGPHHILVHLH